MTDIWDNEGGKSEDEPYEESGDRESRNPIKPKLSGGAELEIPVEEKELVSCQ